MSEPTPDQDMEPEEVLRYMKEAKPGTMAYDVALTLGIGAIEQLLRERHLGQMVDDIVPPDPLMVQRHADEHLRRVVQHQGEQIRLLVELIGAVRMMMAQIVGDDTPALRQARQMMAQLRSLADRRVE